jgi:hypothetical protein
VGKFIKNIVYLRKESLDLDYSQTEVAVDERRDLCSCGGPLQMGHNETDAVRSVRPKGKKRR